MNRRDFITLLGGAAAAWPLAARAETNPPLIAILSVPSRASTDRDGFFQGLRELGLREGQNVRLVERYADGIQERLPGLAEELVGLNPDAILTSNSSSAQAVKQFTSSIPIVVALMADPVRLGLVVSEARPSGNVTGILVTLVGLPGKQLQLAAELVQRPGKIGFLFNSDNPGMKFQQPEIEAAASALAVTIITAGVRTPEDLPGAFRLFADEHVAAVMVGQDGMFISEKSRIGALAAATRLPWVSGRDYAEAGAVIGYGVNLRENYRRAATYVDKILKGARPGDLPVELPVKVEMVINLKSAKALGLTVAPMLLTHADEVIE